jgi:hypothetical protein
MIRAAAGRGNLTQPAKIQPVSFFEEECMGRTLPSATQVFYQEEGATSGFRQGLTTPDRRIFDGLFDSAHRHIAAVSYAAHPLPLEMFLLAMLLEQHKEVMRLRAYLEGLLGRPLDLGVKEPGKLF